ncbi:MAG: hypothetical protein ACR2KB_09435 [Chitinophagaceae bacterium]
MAIARAFQLEQATLALEGGALASGARYRKFPALLRHAGGESCRPDK